MSFIYIILAPGRFSYMFMNVCRCDIWIVANQYGARCTTEFTASTTHVVAAKVEMLKFFFYFFLL
jgi:hypothetical protein